MNTPASIALKHLVADESPTKATEHPAVVSLNQALAGIGQVLPQHITKERMAKLAFGIMRTNPKLALAARRNPASFVNAIMHAAKLGLEPGIDAHLVPYENKKQGAIEIQCIPDYRGLLKLARNSGEITSISIQIAYANDTFDLSLGTEDKLTHKPKLDGNRGEPMLVYAVAKFRDGSHHVEWMPVADINKIRDRSQGYRNAVRYNSETPWITDWEEMSRKTLARRISKYLPRSIELQNAEKLMDAGDKGAPVHWEGDFAVVDEEQPPPAGKADVGDPAPRSGMEPRPAAGADNPPAPGVEAPGLDDAIAVFKKGDYDAARSICPESARDMLEAMITSRENARSQLPEQRPSARRTRASAPAPE